MLQMPLWKRVLILLVVGFGLIYAAPNLFYTKVEAHNDAVAGIALTGVTTPEAEAARAAWPDNPAVWSGQSGARPARWRVAFGRGQGGGCL